MKIITCIILTFSFYLIKAQSLKKILFIGNSLTYWDNSSLNSDFPYYNVMLPILVQMIGESNLNIKIDKVTYGGASLVNHATYIGTDSTSEVFRRAVHDETPSTVKRILSDRWDIVILQEGGAGNVLNPGIRHYTTEPALKFLDSIIKQVQAKTVIYQGYSDPHPEHTYLMYGGQKIPENHCLIFDSIGLKFFADLSFFDPESLKISGRDTTFCSPRFRNTKEKFQALETEYNKLANMVGADIVPIGFAFEKCKKLYPTIELFYANMNDDDDAHPSNEGAYLIACMFYKYITKQSLSKVTYHGGLNESDTKKIRKLVDAIYKP